MGNSGRLCRRARQGIEPGTTRLPALRAEPLVTSSRDLQIILMALLICF